MPTSYEVKSQDEVEVKSQVKQAQSQDARLEQVCGQREPMTVCTTCWGNGMRGPLFMCISEGTVPKALIQDFNAKHKGQAYCAESGTQIHMMTSQTTVLMYEELLGPAFKIQRHRCNLTMQDRGALQCDAFTGNDAFRDGTDAKRQKWSAEHNVALPLPKKGGWSAKGQACDVFHAELRRLQDVVEDKLLGLGESLLNRAPLADSELNQYGIVRAFTPEAKLLKHLIAWRNMPEKLFRFSMIVRGNVSESQMCEMTGMTPKALQAELKSARRLTDPLEFGSKARHVHAGQCTTLWHNRD